MALCALVQGKPGVFLRTWTHSVGEEEKKQMEKEEGWSRRERRRGGK